MIVKSNHLCECGCGAYTNSFIRRGHPPQTFRYLMGHNRRGKPQAPGTAEALRKMNERRSAEAELPQARTLWGGRSKARRFVPKLERCELSHIGGCMGRLARAHVDHNPLNNAAENLKVLCDSHHRLYDFGRIDLANPVMPAFRLKGGRRLYAHNYIPALDKMRAETPIERRRKTKRAQVMSKFPASAHSAIASPTQASA